MRNAPLTLRPPRRSLARHVGAVLSLAPDAAAAVLVVLGMGVLILWVAGA